MFPTPNVRMRSTENLYAIQIIAARFFVLTSINLLKNKTPLGCFVLNYRNGMRFYYSIARINKR